MDLTTPGRLFMYTPVVEEPGIVLQWLVRLRWLALAGQLAATIVAVEFLKIRLPISGMVTIIAVTGFVIFKAGPGGECPGGSCRLC